MALKSLRWYNVKKTDDFVWKEYTKKYYREQLIEMTKDGYCFVIKNSIVKDNKIIWYDAIHPINKLMYERVLSLKPESVFECGCAGGHHLYNIKKLIPEIEVSGCDLLESQVTTAMEFFSIPYDIVKNIKICDFVDYKSEKMYDFVFSNAVVMHLNYDKAVLFILKMVSISKKYVWLSEDCGQHDYIKIFNKFLPGMSVENHGFGYLLTK